MKKKGLALLSFILGILCGILTILYKQYKILKNWKKEWDDVEFDDDCFEDCEICNNYSCPDNPYRDHEDFHHTPIANCDDCEYTDCEYNFVNQCE